MRRRKTHLVCQHMEGLSAALLELYPDIVRDYIRGRHGIYALYKRDRLYYLGLATNLRSRLRAHLRDRHAGLWDRFSVYLTVEGHHIKELESLFLRIMRPKGNTQGGRFPKSEDIKRRLLREIRLRRHEEYQVLVGARQKVSKRKPLKRARREKGKPILGRYVDHRIPIRANYKDHTFVAMIRSDGWISFKGYHYATPSALATELCGRPVNGWSFWHYQRGPGEWVPISTLRH